MSSESVSKSGEKDGKKEKQDEKLKELSKLIDNKINTEDLICEIEKYPAIWDSRTEDYSNKTVKLNAWNSVMVSFLPEVEERSVAEKNILVTIVQKKWKGIRSSYTRELLRQKDMKRGSAAGRHKQYLYFEQLRFLETISKKTTSSTDESEEQVTRHEDSVGNNGETDVALGRIRKRQIIKPKKRGKNEDDKLVSMLKKKNASDGKCKSDKADEDKYFLLSLLSELRKVPEERKLKVRSDIIAVIASAQTPTPQFWQIFPGGPHSSQYNSPGFPPFQPQPQFLPPPNYSQIPFQQPHKRNLNLSPSPPPRTPSVMSTDESDSELSD